MGCSGGRLSLGRPRGSNVTYLLLSVRDLMRVLREAMNVMLFE